MKRTNKEAAKGKSFIALCERAGCEPTARQASKFRNKKGTAYRQWLKEKNNG